MDPLQRSIEVFTRVDDGWHYATVEGAGEDVRIVPFEAAGLNLERVWRGVTGESKE